MLMAASVAAQPSATSAEKVPDQLKGVGVTEHLKAQVPLSLEFTDSSGKTVKLADYFEAGRPVILTLNYYSCPMLCTLQLNGLTEGMKGLSWGPGQEYEVVTVSINPLESYALAASKKQTYLKELQRPSAGPGWHFLVGRQDEISRLADAVGFRYKFDKKTGQFNHVAALMLLTPDGHIARYLYGIDYPTKTLKLGLVEASHGKIGSTIDKIILYCCRYDPNSRRYTPVARNIMRLGGGVTAVSLALVLGTLWVRERRRHAHRPESDSQGTET